MIINCKTSFNDVTCHATQLEYSQHHAVKKIVGPHFVIRRPRCDKLLDITDSCHQLGQLTVSEASEILLVSINSSTNYDSRKESPYCGIALEGQIRSINMTTSTVLLVCVIGIVLLCPWLEAIQNYKCSGCTVS